MLGTGPPPHHIIQQRSPHPIRKYVEKVASQDLDDYPDWDLTAPLPKLPVPELKRTMAAYLQSVQPIVRPEQFEYTRRLTEEFCEVGGPGERLQARLQDIAQTEDNWAYSYWLDDMYMRNRLALPVNSNPGTVFPQQRFDNNMDAQLKYAAKLISGILDYKMIIDCRGLPVDRARHHERGQPLCMEQYYRLFTSYRFPGLPKDRLLDTHPQDGLAIGANMNNHVIVAHKNQFFVLNVIVNHVRLSDDNILTQLKRITKMVDNAGDSGVGILTAGHRDLWAEARQLLALDERNKANLELIENCIFVLCLDKAVPTTLNPAQPGRDCSSLAHQMLHGQGSKLNTPNRWFDKTMQFVIGADGAVGLCYEHSPSEGIAVVDLIEHLLKYLVEREKKLLRMQSLSELPYPKKLEWTISAEVDKLRQRIAMETDSLISDLSLYILDFKEYGREFPKSQNMSPDSYIQLALQLTYYKVHGCLVSTYESASIRRFRLGRVDNIRACTMDALEFAKAMVGELLCSSQEKVRLLRKAIKKQTEILLQTILGYGFDNHLLGLRELAAEEGIETPELFRDDTYCVGHKFALSTSQVPTKMENTFMCYGPVVPDGYGACYNPHPDSILVVVSSFRSCAVTDSERFALALRDSLLEMRDLCLQTAVPAANSTGADVPSRIDVVVNGVADVTIAS